MVHPLMGTFAAPEVFVVVVLRQPDFEKYETALIKCYVVTYIISYVRNVIIKYDDGTYLLQ